MMNKHAFKRLNVFFHLLSFRLHPAASSALMLS
jgi:hypothetical protein